MSHGKIGVCAWRFSARLFHYAHPLVLANVMHECTYHTLASHADTCRLDFCEIGRACAFHKGNFLAPLCGGRGMVGARFLSTAYRRQLLHVYAQLAPPGRNCCCNGIDGATWRPKRPEQPSAPVSKSRRCKTGRDECSRLADQQAQRSP